MRTPAGQIAVQAKGFREPIIVYDLRGLRGRWERMLPEPEVELRELDHGVDVQYALLEGKHIDYGQQGNKRLQYWRRRFR